MLSVFLGNNLKCKVILFLIFTTNFISGKILVLELWAKMLSAIKLQDSLKCNISRKGNDEVYFWDTDKHQSLLQVDTIILGMCNQAWRCATRHAQGTQNKNFAYLCNISRKNMGGRVELIICLQIYTKVLYKLIISVLVYVAMHAQNTQNKFTVSL